jgi:chromosome segregation ATPase
MMGDIEVGREMFDRGAASRDAELARLKEEVERLKEDNLDLIRALNDTKEKLNRKRTEEETNEEIRFLRRQAGSGGRALSETQRNVNVWRTLAREAAGLLRKPKHDCQDPWKSRCRQCTWLRAHPELEGEK